MYFANLRKFYLNSCPYLDRLGHIALVLAAFVCPISITATDIFMPVAAALCLLSGLFFSEFKLVKSHPLVRIALVFFGLVIIDSLWGIGVWHDISSALHKYAKLLYIPLLIPLCLNKRWRPWIINAFLLAVGITVLLSYFKAFLGIQFVFGHSQIHPSYIFTNHIETSYFIAFATYLLAHRAWTAAKYRWIYWILVIAFTYQEFFINDGRTGWIVYFGLVVLFCIHHCQKDALSPIPMKFSYRLLLIFRAIGIGAVIAILLSLLAYQFSPAFKSKIHEASADLQCSVLTQEKTSGCFRISFYKFSLHLIKHNVIFGLGTGSFAEANRRVGGIPGWTGHLVTPHSDYLHILVQFGLVGLVIFLYFYYWQWRISFNLGRERQIAQALIFSFMLASLFNTFIYASVTGHFYVLFTSLFFARTSPEGNRS